MEKTDLSKTEDKRQSDEAKKKESLLIKRYLWTSAITAIVIGIIAISFISGNRTETTSDFLKAFGCGVLIAGASLSTGGVLGFIFGIPSISQIENQKFRYNDNLVQISDWLTKIIVGVGLTQLYHIPGFIKKIGQQFQVNFGETTWAANVSIAIMAYFFVLGFMMIYFWTKTDYSTIIKNTDDDLNEKLAKAEEEKKKAEQESREASEKSEELTKKLEDETKAKENIEQEKKTMAQEVAQKETKTLISESNIASATDETTTLTNDKNPQLATDVDNLKAYVQSILPTKRVVVEDDPQKSRWGGKAENNGRIIKAEVSQNTWQNLFDVVISVSNTDNTPLSMPVAIFVHNSYQLPNDVVYVIPDQHSGSAVLKILSYEAFTLGALFADGTELELDLNERPGYPTDFYWENSTE